MHLTSVPANRARNSHVDFFRGLALWWIFLDHVRGDWLGKATFQHIGACDAAELFVLLAGFSSSYAYGAAFFRQGWGIAAGKILRRAFTIYAAQFVLFCFLWAEVALLAGSNTAQRVLQEMSLGALEHVSIADIGAVLTFSCTVAFTDILPLYVLLLVGFAAILPLLRVPRVLLTLSVALYAATYVLDLNLPGLPAASRNPGWVGFNPLAWQVLLVVGAVLVIQPGLRPQPRAAWDAAAAAIVLGALGLRIASYLARREYDDAMPPLASHWGPVFSWMEDSIRLESAKTNLHPIRLVNILAWAWLAYRLSPVYGRFLDRVGARPLVLCGRHSLPVFCAGVVLAPLGAVWLAYGAGLAVQATVNLAGAAILVSVAALAGANKSRRRIARTVIATAPRAAGP